MLPTRQGSIRLFRFASIEVYLHWSWFIVAAYQFTQRADRYYNPIWAAAEYLSLFCIVLMHEFGHSLACRSVGGYADQIVLWPFGGVAYVSPPERPGAQLWSIVAGPLVNVVLMPVFVGLYMYYDGRNGWGETGPDSAKFVTDLFVINSGLLLYNILPIYPLDGGQILRSLLWFVRGRGRSLQIATIIGMVGGGILACIALWAGWVGLVSNRSALWIFLITLFLMSNCWRALRRSRELIEIDRLRV